MGERIVILGSGDIGLIMARRLTLNGKKVLAVVEQSERCGGLPRNRIQCVEDFGIPLLTRSTVERLYGVGRLTGVRISDGGTGYDLDCDTLIVSVGLVPETDLLWKLGTIPPWLFVCGNANIIRVLADDIADDGAAAGRNAAGLIKEL